MSQPGQIDPAALERLRRMGGDDFTLKMTDLFLSYGAQKIGEARQALQAANPAGVAKAVHAIKSSAGNAGAIEVQVSVKNFGIISMLPFSEAGGEVFPLP